MSETTGTIRVYGKLDCADTRRTRDVLERAGAAYAFFDVAADEAQRVTAERLGDSPSVPVVVMPGGEVAVEPTDEWVMAHLGQAGHHPR